MSKKYECWYCGIETEIEIQNLRAFCPECFEEHKQKHLEIVKKYANLKTKIMFETALRILEKSGIAVNKYQDSAFAVIESALSDTEKFLSSYEIIAAIILEHNGYDYKSNYTIGRYRVDFYIPELKVCLEIDGSFHNGKEIRDNKRDVEIRNTLGKEWEVLRIATKYLDQNAPMLIKAIEELKKEKLKWRDKYNGLTPDWYSLREKKHYQKQLKSLKLKDYIV